MQWTILKLLEWTTDYFKKRQIPSARLDAELLLAHVLGCRRVQLYTRFDQPLSAGELAGFRAMVSRRGAREPLAYLLGRKEFWALDFEVGPGVLVPRPDTERLVEEAVRILGPRPRPPDARKVLPWSAALEDALRTRQEERSLQPVADVEEGSAASSSVPGMPEDPPDAAHAVATTAPDMSSGAIPTAPGSARSPEGDVPLMLDLCTGSGIIPVCLVRSCEVRAVGVDISPDALAFARRNADRLAPPGAIAFLEGDLSAPVPRRFHGRFVLLTANPPYIPASVLPGLEPEVSRHEPALALVGGEDGLEFYRQISIQARRMLRPGGHILLEVGDTAQGEEVIRLLEERGFTEPRLLKDLAGQDRVVRAQLEG